METRADKITWSVDQEGTWLHLLVQDGQTARAYAETQSKPQKVKLTAWRNRRSQSANAYAWTLMGKLSAALGIPPEEIYWQLIPDVGDNATMLSIPIESLDEFRDKWSGNGLGWRVEVIGASHPGMVDVAAYYGSSTYDTAQMARLIDLIIDECRENGIEYRPEEEIKAMLEEWDEKTNASAGNQQRDEASSNAAG